MINGLAAWNLFLSATGLASFIASYLNRSIADLTAGSLVLCLFYCAVNFNYTLLLLRQRQVTLWLLFFLIWPLATVVYTASTNYLYALLSVYHAALFLSSAIFIARAGIEAFGKVMLSSFLITALGSFLSLFRPDLFLPTLELAGADLDQGGRAYGFLLQPNSLAAGLVVMFIGTYTSCAYRQSYWPMFLLPLLFASVVITGSRMGILFALITAGYCLVSVRATDRRRLVASAVASVTLTALAIFGAGSWLVRHVVSQYAGFEQLEERMDRLLSLQLADEGNLREDGSISERLSAQELYLSAISKSPFAGYGLGAAPALKETGELGLSAHADGLELALAYGVPFVFFLAAWLVVLPFSSAVRAAERAVGFRFMQLFCALLVAAVAYGSLIEHRFTYVVAGALFGLLPNLIARRG